MSDATDIYPKPDNNEMDANAEDDRSSENRINLPSKKDKAVYKSMMKKHNAAARAAADSQVKAKARAAAQAKGKPKAKGKASAKNAPKEKGSKPVEHDKKQGKKASKAGPAVKKPKKKDGATWFGETGTAESLSGVEEDPEMDTPGEASDTKKGSIGNEQRSVAPWPPVLAQVAHSSLGGPECLQLDAV